VQGTVAAARRLTQRVTHADNASLGPAEDTDGSVADSGRGSEEEARDIEDAVADTEPARRSGDTKDAVANTEPARRFARLHVCFQSSGVGVTAWALASKGRGNPDKMRMYQAKLAPDCDLLDAAIRADVDALCENGTWELVDLPRGRNVTQMVMLCERKRGADGEVTKHKGLYFVRGDTQK